MSLVETDPYSVFLFGMRSPKTKEKVVPRLKMFFDFIDIRGDPIEQLCKVFVEKARSNQNWIFSNLIQYLQYHKERVEKKEISAGTVKNYYQAVKLFCEMNQIDLPWKRISKALPKVKRYADDRAHTSEEIRSIVNTPIAGLKQLSMS